jgi:probable HAF family extracellular repeat protein
MPGVDIEVSLSSATAVCPDGSVIVGWAWNEDYEQEAFVRTEDDGMVGLGTIGGQGRSSIAQDVAVATETIVVGRCHYGDNHYEAFRWTPATGMVGLGDLPGGLDSSSAKAVSADGSVIVGYANGDSGIAAAVWDSQHGFRDLKQILEGDYGLDLSEWAYLNQATAISDDGLTIVGFGRHNEVREAWVAHIPEPTTGLLLFTGGLLIWSSRRGRRIPTR